MQDSEKNTIMRNEFTQNIKCGNQNIRDRYINLCISENNQQFATNNFHRILSGCASNINYSRL